MSSRLIVRLPFLLTWRSAVCAGVALTAASCGSEPSAARPAVASVSITGAPAGGVIVAGQTAQLATTVKDAAGATLTDRSVSWSSSNGAAVSVSATGLATAAGVGTATITATVEGQSATVDLSARAAVTAPASGASQPAVTSVMNGALTVTVPPGAVPAGTVLSAGPAPSSLVPATSRLLSGTAFAFGPEGTQFAVPVTIALRFDATGLSATDRAALAVYGANGGNWDRVAGSTVSAGESVVSAPVSHFSVYAVLKRAEPSALSAYAGNNQSAVSGATVAVRPAVLVADSRGQPVPGVSVTFSVGLGGGSITGAAATSDANGIATVGSWTLGSIGENTLTATVAGINPIAFTATATTPPPPIIQLSSSVVAFTLTTGNAPPAAQTVSVTNAGTAPLTDLAVGAVSYSAGASGWLTATLSVAAAPATLSLGIVGAGGLQLGTYTASVQVVSATASNSPRTVTVSLSVVATTARSLVLTTQPGGTRSGFVFETQPVVEIRDAAGNRVTTATSTVTAVLTAGPGELSGTTAVVAVAGVATFTDLKVTGKGSTQITFESGTLGPAVTPSFWVADGTPANVGAYAGMNQTAELATTLPIPIAVRVTDVDGFPVPGVLVAWQVMSGGGSLAITTLTTNSNGVASVVWTLGANLGIQQVTAAVTGALGSPVTISATATAPPPDQMR